MRIARFIHFFCSVIFLYGVNAAANANQILCPAEVYCSDHDYTTCIAKNSSGWVPSGYTKWGSGDFPIGQYVFIGASTYDGKADTMDCVYSSAGNSSFRVSFSLDDCSKKVWVDTKSATWEQQGSGKNAYYTCGSIDNLSYTPISPSQCSFLSEPLNNQ